MAHPHHWTHWIHLPHWLHPHTDRSSAPLSNVPKSDRSTEIWTIVAVAAVMLGVMVLLIVAEVMGWLPERDWNNMPVMP